MANSDRTRGYRDNQAYRRQQPAEPSSDPLAELARLIGQQNESGPSHRPGAGSPYGEPPQPDPAWRGGTHRQDAGASHWPDNPGSSNPAAPQYGDRHYPPHYDADTPQAHPDYSATPDFSYGDPRYADPHYPDAQYADPRYADPRYPDPHHTDPRYAGRRYDDPAGYGYSDPRYAEPNYDAQHYGAPSYAPASQGYAQSGDPSYPAHAYQDGAHAYENSYYGTPPAPPVMARARNEYAPAKRRGSIVTVLAVLTLAVVGTAAAFGYRTMFGSSGSPVPPPVIQADTKPTKIVPATDSNSKPIQDRIGVKTERIVPRQEEPVQQAAPGQPRVIAPFLAGQNPQAFPPASASVAPSGSARPAAPFSAEPKRVRTVPIKPPQGTQAPGPRSSRSGAPAERSESASAADSQSPMALAPTGSVPPSQQPSGRQAHAAVTPNDTGAGSPFPTPLPPSSGPARAAVSGPYGVQVTSQRSEADAQASFRSLQQRFPSVLGNRQPVIRRADLGARGTYYRAQVPFSSQSEANEFCSSLKAAGGQCVVQRN